MHSSERKKISQALSVSCKIHRIKHAKCCAEDKAPRGYSSGWKIQIHTKKKMDENENLKSHSAKTANL
jgi:hypothetical protein